MKTREQKLADIREACIKVNPEIVELKFGCQLDLAGFHCTIVNAWPKHKRYLVINLTEPKTKWYTEGQLKYTQAFKIIGRDVKLSDLLYTIKSICLSVDGRDEYAEAYNSKNELVRFWNLLKDSLNDQSDECVDFIYSLLPPVNSN